MRVLFLYLPAAFLFLGQSAQAQLPFLDISSSTQNANELQVKIRPDGDFDGLFSSVVFTVRCNLASGVLIGDPLQGLPQAQYCSIFKSDAQQGNGAYTYQIYAGFGNSALSNFGTSWVADQEVLFCTIPLSNANGGCKVVNDAWTDTHNGGYYVSLNGVDRTGIIYSITTAVDPVVDEEQWFRLVPNPANDHVGLFLRTDAPGTKASVILLDAAGRKVREVSALLNGGVLDMDLDLKGLAAGLYTLQVGLADRQLSRSMVVE